MQHEQASAYFDSICVGIVFYIFLFVLKLVIIYLSLLINHSIFSEGIILSFYIFVCAYVGKEVFSTYVYW